MRSVKNITHRCGKALVAIALLASFLLPFAGYTGINFGSLFDLPTSASEYKKLPPKREVVK